MREPTFDEACALTAGAAMWASVAVPEAGIADFTMADGPMGIASGDVDERDISRLTPCAAALGASWDRDLVRRVGALVGHEAVERGIDAVLAPNLNLARSPLAGRAFEYFSEDPVLTGVLGAQWIAGLQSTGTGSVAKHLVCNDSETDRDRLDVWIDERSLREVYLLPFEYAAGAGCAAMLAAYNRVNGSWCTESAHILTDIVKGDWGYRGLVMSDWFGTHSTAPAINAGLDLEMPGPARFLGANVADAVRGGAVDPARVVDAAARVAWTARQVTGTKAPPIAGSEAQALLREAAAAGMVLVRNCDAMLPIVPESAGRIAIIGPNAAAPCYQGGTFAKIAVAPDTPRPIDAIIARYAPHSEVVFEPGVDPQPRLPAMPVRPALDIGDGCTAGVSVEYFTTPDFSGSPVFRETRDANSLVWFAGQHRQSRFDLDGSIRVSGRFRAETQGDHLFYVGSTGDARVLVDGVEVLAAGGAVAASDVMGVLKRGDARTVVVPLAAGQDVLVEIAFRYTAARAQGLWFGIRRPDTAEAMFTRAVEAARAADTVVLIVGETSDSSVESKDRPDTAIAADQVRLIEAVCAANPRTAIVANVGHAFDSRWEDRAAALLIAWYPGQGFAEALAAVLAGDTEPGGRMPVTIAHEDADYPALELTPEADGALRYLEGTRFGYRGLIASGAPARHAFGSGMGYARFEWSDVAAEDGAVSLLVRNCSDRAGSDVVQIYRDEPECALVGFAKVTLAPGEERRIFVPVEPRAMRMWHDGWTVLTAPLRVARSAEDRGTVV